MNKLIIVLITLISLLAPSLATVSNTTNGEMPELHANSISKKSFSVVGGTYTSQIVDQSNLTKITTYDEVESIPVKELKNKQGQVYQLGKNHYLIHKSQIGYPQTSKINDAWLEVQFQDPKRFYGSPVADTVLYTQSGGSASFSKSLEFGASIVRYSSFQRSAWVLGVSTAASLTFGPSVSVKADASCTIPAGKTGGLYLFERSERYNGQIREWRLESKRFKTAKYYPGDWEPKDEAIRAFKHPIFVCSLDPQYIDSLKQKTSEPYSPFTDYSEYIHIRSP